MIYYFSAPSNYADELFACKAKSFLLSYAVDAVNHWRKFHNPEIPLLIDSGAYTIWNSLAPKINVRFYKNFCLTLPKESICISLDVIPPKACTRDEMKKCCKQGFENYLYLRDYLPNVMPVFHYKDDLEWLLKYQELAPYIGIATNEIETDLKIVFLDSVFRYLKPGIKTHSLGFTTDDGMKKYPFYSVDSTSWKSGHRFGGYIHYNHKSNSLTSYEIAILAKHLGIPYNTTMKVPKELISASIKASIVSILDFMAWVTERNKTQNFDYLHHQLSLF